VLDSFFWSKVDPSKYVSDILATVPNVGRSLLPKVNTDSLTFLTGLSALYHAEKDDQIAEKAFIYLSEALEVDPIIIKGFISSPKATGVASKTLRTDSASSTPSRFKS
jgi:hypothetical protein